MSKQKQSSLENKIFEYKLKEIQAWKTFSFIIEVNGKTVCVNRKQTMILSDAIFPTEFTNIEIHQVRKVIVGAEIKVYSVREWYKKQLQNISQLMLTIREEAI